MTDAPSVPPAGAPPSVPGTNGAGDAVQITLLVAAQYVKDLSFENPNPDRLRQPMTQAPEVGIGIGAQARGLGNDEYEVQLDIRAEAKIGADTLYLVELSYAGVFQIKAPADYMEPLLFIEGPRLLFPFARQIIANVSREGGFAPLLVNPVDFADLYRRRVEEARAQQGAQPTTTEAGHA